MIRRNWEARCVEFQTRDIAVGRPAQDRTPQRFHFAFTLCLVDVSGPIFGKRHRPVAEPGAAWHGSGAFGGAKRLRKFRSPTIPQPFTCEPVAAFPGFFCLLSYHFGDSMLRWARGGVLGRGFRSTPIPHPRGERRVGTFALSPLSGASQEGRRPWRNAFDVRLCKGIRKRRLPRP